MDLRQEYKKSAEIMNPSAEAMERMKRNILAKAAQPEKKAFPFKKLAYAGGAVAACAVIAVAAANVLPSLGAKNDMAQADVNSEAAVYAVADYDNTAGAEELSAAQDAAADYADYSDCSVPCDGAASENTTAATTYEPKNDSFIDYISDSIFDNAMTEAEAEYFDADASADEDYAAEAPSYEDSCVDAATNHTHVIATLEISDDRQRCVIGDTVFVLVPPDILTQFTLPEAQNGTEYPSLDGNTYTVLDYGDFVGVLCDGEQLGIYCTPEMLDEF